jgi:MFS family permease
VHDPQIVTTDIGEITGPDVVNHDAIKALIGSALGYAMDGFDLLILGFMLRVISADLSLNPAQGASLVTATLIGAVIGGIVFGMLSERIGRVRVLTYTIVVFAVFTRLCGLGRGYYDLLAFRGLAGLGLGGEFGIGMALVAEAWPATMRARASSYVGLGWQLGVLAAAIVTPILLPLITWRGMFMLGISQRSRLTSFGNRCTSRKYSSRNRMIIPRNPRCIFC